jgi:hypothetical protein
MHNTRNRQAAKVRPPQAFPADVVIPPHRGSSPCVIEMPPPLVRAAAPVRPAPKRKAAKRKKKAVQRRRKVAAKPPVIALPQRSEPLALPEPAIDIAAWSALAPPQPAQPLPRSRAVALHRSGGMLDALAVWLGTRTWQLWRRLGRLELRRSAQGNAELQRLRAENERLRLQLEALLALQTGAGGSQAPSPA